MDGKPIRLEMNERSKKSNSNKGRSLLIQNLSYTTSPERIRRIFEKCGDIRDVYIPLDYYTKKPRGFCFVEYFSESDAEQAINELNRTIIEGKEIVVLMAQDRRKSPETMRAISYGKRHNYLYEKRRWHPSEERPYERYDDDHKYYNNTGHDYDSKHYKKKKHSYHGESRSPSRMLSMHNRRYSRSRSSSWRRMSPAYRHKSDYKKTYRSVSFSAEKNHPHQRSSRRISRSRTHFSRYSPDCHTKSLIDRNLNHSSKSNNRNHYDDNNDKYHHSSVYKSDRGRYRKNSVSRSHYSDLSLTYCPQNYKGSKEKCDNENISIDKVNSCKSKYQDKIPSNHDRSIHHYRSTSRSHVNV